MGRSRPTPVIYVWETPEGRRSWSRKMPLTYAEVSVYIHKPIGDAVAEALASHIWDEAEAQKAAREADEAYRAATKGADDE